MPTQTNLGLLFLATLGCLAGCRSDDVGRGVPPDAKVETVPAIQPNAAVHAAAGDLAVNQGNRAEAIRQFARAVELAPDEPLHLYKLATLYAYDAQAEASIHTWERYLDATGGSANAHNNLGRAHELAGHWEQAEACYQTALRVEPTNKSAIVNYGLMLAKRERTDEAVAQLAKALTPAEVQYNLGSVHELRKEFAAAQSAYERAIALDGKLIAARQRLEMLRGVTSAR